MQGDREKRRQEGMSLFISGILVYFIGGILLGGYLQYAFGPNMVTYIMALGLRLLGGFLGVYGFWLLFYDSLTARSPPLPDSKPGPISPASSPREKHARKVMWSLAIIGTIVLAFFLPGGVAIIILAFLYYALESEKGSRPPAPQPYYQPPPYPPYQQYQPQVVKPPSQNSKT